MLPSPKSSKSFINPYYIAIASLAGCFGYMLYQSFKSRKTEEPESTSDQAVSASAIPLAINANTNSQVTTAPELILSGNKNYYDTEKKILCNNVITRKEVIKGQNFTKQVYIPLTKPTDYIEPTEKTFEVECSTDSNHMPTFSESIQPCSNTNGLIAFTEAQRHSNLQKIAYAIGKIKNPSVAIKPITGEVGGEAYATYIPSIELITYLSKLLAKEVLYENTYDSQREMVAILWCLINRMTTGYTAPAEKNVDEFKKMVKKSIAYDPESITAGSKLEKVANCLIPLVKSFFMGYFNDETHGSTHWAHFSSLRDRCPPAYYYPQGTQRTEGNELKPHQLRPNSVQNYYIGECVFVKVDEKLNGR